MVLYTLYIKANLEGVASLRFKQGADVCLSVRNPLDRDEIRERIVVDSSALEDPQDEHQTHHLKRNHKEHPCHFALRWGGATTRATIRVQQNDEIYLPKDSGTFVPMMSLECENVEPFCFHNLGNEFIITDNAGVEYSETDFSDSGAWKQFDLGTGSKSVTHFETKFK